MSELKSYLIQVESALKSLRSQSCEDAVEVVKDSLLSGCQVFTCGNGGSAATASHFVTDWLKGIREDFGIKPVAHSLNANLSTLTAIANDIDYSKVFSFQVESLMKPSDVLVVVSGSGNSENVIEALKAAKIIGARTVGVLGFDGGKALALCDYAYHIQTSSMQAFEDISGTFGHAVLVH